jgi:hypothetical protein
MPETGALARLASDGLVEPGVDGPRTTRRWQGAMARAALRLMAAGAPWRDLRLPIASALAELYPEASDEELAEAIEALLPLEARGAPPDLAALTPPG